MSVNGLAVKTASRMAYTVSGGVLNSVLNSAARRVYSARRSERVMPLLRELHWLWVPERIQFRLCVLTYRCLHGSAPSYLAETLHLTSDMESRRRQRSGSTSSLMVPSSRRATLGDRAFPMAAAQAWNSLPTSFRSPSSYLTFRRNLKLLPFNASFKDD